VSYDVELEIGPADGASGYEVIVVRSPAGEATGSLRLDVAGLLARRRELQATVLASAVTARSLTTMELSLREVGQALFAALFTGPVYGRYTASVAAAAERGEPLRVVLRLHTSELAACPGRRCTTRKPVRTSASGKPWCAMCRWPHQRYR